MSYQLKAGTDVGKGARRIALSQNAAALDSLQSAGARSPDPEAILACRKRIKKVRGLLRLVRGSIGEHYRIADRQYRDATNALTGLRDSHAQLEVFDRAVRARWDLLPPDGVLTVRAELAHRADWAAENVARRPRSSATQRRQNTRGSTCAF